MVKDLGGEKVSLYDTFSPPRFLSNRSARPPHPRPSRPRPQPARAVDETARPFLVPFLSPGAGFPGPEARGTNHLEVRGAAEEEGGKLFDNLVGKAVAAATLLEG